MRPDVIDKTGRRTLVKVTIPDSAGWGTVGALATQLVNAQTGAFDIYVAAPSLGQILRYAPSVDGSGYPTGNRSGYSSAPGDVSAVKDMYVDGNVYLASNGKLAKYLLGLPATDWAPSLPSGGQDFTLLAADDAAQNHGNLYAYDAWSHTVVVLRKSDGAVVARYSAGPDMADVHGMFVADDSAHRTLYWTEPGKLMRAQLP